MPCFTIITVAYNAQETIGNTIASLASQSFKDYQYILVDGKSSDATLDIMQNETRDWEQDVVVISERDKGIYDAMNKGIRCAQGEYIYLLNADDSFLNDDVLHKVDQALKDQSTLPDILYGNLIYRSETGEKVLHFTPDTPIRDFLRSGCITQQAIFYHKPVFEKVGLFNQSYSIVGDYEWLLRAVFRKRISTSYVNLDLADFFLGGVSTDGSARDRHHRQRDRLYRRFFPKKYILDSLHKLKKRLFP